MFKKKVTLPTKKSMNLYQVDTKNDPKKLIAYGVIAVLLIALVFVRFVVIEGINNINSLNEQIASMEDEYASKTQRYEGYSQLKENYYRYSEKYAQAEEKLIDRITILELLDESTADLASVTSTNISGNQVNLKIVTENLDDLATLRNILENNKMVQNVVVYSATRTTGDVVTTIAFDCVTGEGN